MNLLLKIPIINSVIKKKIKQSLGLSRANLIMTGASITPESLKQWYRSLGINLRMDNEGYFKIIGRVKDAFKTTRGKFIVPTVLEDKFSENELIEQICVVGLGISQPIALVNLSEIGLAAPREDVEERLKQQHMSQYPAWHQGGEAVVWN